MIIAVYVLIYIIGMFITNTICKCWGKDFFGGYDGNELKMMATILWPVSAVIIICIHTWKVFDLLSSRFANFVCPKKED